MSEPGSYADYLAKMRAQQERDRDRMTGRDMHLDQPIYDPDTGDMIHHPRARLVIELDDDALPIIVEAVYVDKADIDGLARAADAWRYRTQYGWGETPREQALRIRRQREERIAEHEQWMAERPHICDDCGGGRARFKTAGGLAIHKRSHKR